MTKKAVIPPEPKFNMTIIDRDSTVENFLYRGVSGSDKTAIEQSFKDKNEVVIQFHYDEGDVLVSKEQIHTLVFSDYISEADDTPDLDL